MGTSSKKLAGDLRELAAKQHGCFTAAQAIEVGYADSVHLYHVKNGKWNRLYRGVYCFADAPQTPDLRGMAALLWTRDKNGVILGNLCPNTAAAIRSGGLTEFDTICVQVPEGFRRSTAAPDGLKIEVLSKKPQKTGKNGRDCEEADEKTAEILKKSSRISSKWVKSAPGGLLDMPDYYDWLDFRAVAGSP